MRDVLHSPSAPTAPRLRLPWFARTLLVANVYRLLLLLKRNALAFCSWHTDTLAFDSRLRVRLIDLGQMRHYNERFDAPMFSDLPCTAHTQCAAPHVSCLWDNLHTDARCTSDGFCQGYTSRTWVQKICNNVQSLLSVSDTDDTDADFAPVAANGTAATSAAAVASAAETRRIVRMRLEEVHRGCSETNASERWSVERVISTLYRVLRANGGFERLRASATTIAHSYRTFQTSLLAKQYNMCPNKILC